MALGFKKVYTNDGIPIFINNFEVATGGFKLDNTGLLDGETIKAGSLMVYDESTRLAKVVKTAEVYEAGNQVTSVKVKKGSLLKVGDSVDGVAIEAIDASNADYDAITLATAVDVAAGDILSTIDVTGKSTGLLQASKDVADNETVSIVIRGTAYKRRIPPVSEEQLPKTLVLSNSF